MLFNVLVENLSKRFPAHLGEKNTCLRNQGQDENQLAVATREARKVGHHKSTDCSEGH